MCPVPSSQRLHLRVQPKRGGTAGGFGALEELLNQTGENLGCDYGLAVVRDSIKIIKSEFDKASTSLYLVSASPHNEIEQIIGVRVKLKD